MVHNYFLLFHAKGFSYVNNIMKPYSMQYLSSSEPMTDMAQCLVAISLGCDHAIKIIFTNYVLTNLKDQFSLVTL